MPHHHMQHMRNVGPDLFMHNENSAYIMPRVTACAVTLCVHCVAHARRQASRSYINVVAEITYGHAMCASQTIFIKNNRFTF